MYPVSNLRFIYLDFALLRKYIQSLKTIPQWRIFVLPQGFARLLRLSFLYVIIFNAQWIKHSFTCFKLCSHIYFQSQIWDYTYLSIIYTNKQKQIKYWKYFELPLKRSLWLHMKLSYITKMYFDCLASKRVRKSLVLLIWPWVSSPLQYIKYL